MKISTYPPCRSPPWGVVKTTPQGRFFGFVCAGLACMQGVGVEKSKHMRITFDLWERERGYFRGGLMHNHRVCQRGGVDVPERSTHPAVNPSGVDVLRLMLSSFCRWTQENIVDNFILHCV